MWINRRHAIYAHFACADEVVVRADIVDYPFAQLASGWRPSGTLGRVLANPRLRESFRVVNVACDFHHRHDPVNVSSLGAVSLR